MSKYTEIKALNDSLLQQEISLVIMGVEKNRMDHIQDLWREMLAEKLISGIKFVVFVDAAVDVNDLKDVAWLVLNNIDPQRDISITGQTMMIDGTSKTKTRDHFNRPWPNVIVMDEETIQSIDKKWSGLGLGNFIESPSLKYKKLLRRGGACVEE
jgi:4-hydroxy-3-polyprenylbenzoate decarboxylase